MIVHLDADCFFVSVERIKNPELIGKAVVVGGSARGVVASASYEARKYGIKAAMPIWQAKQLCSSVLVLPTDMQAYQYMSNKLFQYLENFSPTIEKQSIDEGYIDIVHAKDPQSYGKEIQSAINLNLGLSTSLGIAASKLVSQIAGKLHKPNGFTFIPKGSEAAFLASLDISWLPGFGPKTSARLEAKGIYKIADIVEMSEKEANEFFGKNAKHIRELANGVDQSIVNPEEREAKSYGEQDTFTDNSQDKDFVSQKIKGMADNIMRRIRKDKKFARTIEIRLRNSRFEEAIKAYTLKIQTDNEEEIYKVIDELLTNMWKGSSIRLAGFRVTKVTQDPPNAEFNFTTSRKKSVTALLDMLKDTLGEDKIWRAHTPKPSIKKKK